MTIVNPEYQQQLATMHSQGQFVRGGKGLKSLRPFIDQYQPRSLLDFGCGHGGLMRAIQEHYPHMLVKGYDPGSEKHHAMPTKATDVIVSLDVFEHIEPEHLDQTLQLIASRMLRAGWFRIACYPAKKLLPDGRNAHLIVQPPSWWRQQILANMNVRIVHEEIITIDKSHKWPGVVGENYDLTVEVM